MCGEAMGMSFNRAVLLICAAWSLSLTAGCQVQSVPTKRLIQHQAIIDLAGLEETQVVEDIKAHVAAPQKWEALKPKKTALFVDRQWRSPSKETALGVAYIRLPIPLPANGLVWLAKKEY